jgi:hypothetical protein
MRVNHVQGERAGTITKLPEQVRSCYLGVCKLGMWAQQGLLCSLFCSGATRTTSQPELPRLFVWLLKLQQLAL